MAKFLVSDELWALIEPLIPKHVPSVKGGHPPVSDRVCFTGIFLCSKPAFPGKIFHRRWGVAE
jgi:transposase